MARIAPPLREISTPATGSLPLLYLNEPDDRAKARCSVGAAFDRNGSFLSVISIQRTAMIGPNGALRSAIDSRREFKPDSN